MRKSEVIDLNTSRPTSGRDDDGGRDPSDSGSVCAHPSVGEIKERYLK